MLSINELCATCITMLANMQEIQSVARVILIWLDTARIKNMRLTVRRKILRYVASIYGSRHCQRRSIIHHYNTTKK